MSEEAVNAPTITESAHVFEIRDNNVPLLVFVSITYLALPSLIFFATFAKPLFGFPALIVLGFVLLRLAQQTDFSARFYPSDILLLIAASVWTVLAGITPPFGQNDDWLKHYAILDFLDTSTWPPSINDESLRYSLGWYLPPAALMKVLGLHDSDTVVALWTIFGAFLSLRLLTPKFRGVRQVGAAALIFIFFSGLDIIGGIFMDRGLGLANHLEWWSAWGQMSSHMTSFFWVQQHALAAWIAVGLMLCMTSDQVSRLSVFLFALIIFWSPFVAIGLTPFAAWLTFRSKLKSVLSIDNMVALVPAVLMLSYLLAGSAGIVHQPVWTYAPFTWGSFVLFLLVEWAIITLAVLYAGTPHKTLIAVIGGTLTVLPLYRFGEYNDLLMRGSAPAIAFLAVIATEALFKQPIARTVPLIIALSIGAVTGIAEIRRDVSKPHANSSHIKFEEYAKELGSHRSQYLTAKPFLLR